MKITFWGTRGSIPLPSSAGGGGSSWGGNTPCVEVETDGGDLLILDGGMGLHWLGQALLKNAFGQGQGSAHILITHPHWGHIQGIPFCAPLLIPGNRFIFYGRGSQGCSLEDLLRAQMDTTYCPVPNFFDDDIGARIRVCETDDGEFRIGRIRITARQVNHAAGTICRGYRLDDDTASLAYLPDVEYLQTAHRDQALELAHDVDLLIHDAHYTATEYEQRRGCGHCCDRDAVEIALAASVRHLLLFHHHPDHDDPGRYAAIDEYADCQLTIETACEGAQYVLGKGISKEN